MNYKLCELYNQYNYQHIQSFQNTNKIHISF